MIPVYDVRRHTRSSARSNERTSRSASGDGGTTSGERDGSATTSTLTSPPERAATWSNRAFTSSSCGRSTFGGTAPSAPTSPKISRCNGAFTQFQPGAQCATTWHRARVSAT